MKVVLDANVVLAAFCFPGVCRSVMDVCIDSHDLITSEYLLSEIRDHLREKFGHNEAMADERILLLRDAATVVTPVNIPDDACRDADDLPVLGTMVAGDAQCLVTGDHDLLTLGQYDGRMILSPRGFWDRLRDPA